MLPRKDSSIFIISTFFLLALSFFQILRAEVVEMILAKVQNKVFTLSDYQIARKFQLVEIVFNEVETSDPDHYLVKLIETELIYREGSILKIVKVSNEEIKETLNNIKSSISENYSVYLDDLDIREEFLIKLIQEKLIAKKHYDIRVNFFKGFGEEDSKTKIREWLDGLKTKAKMKILTEDFK